MHDRNPHPRPSPDSIAADSGPAEQPDDSRDSVEEALLILSRMLGRQAARDWLSADICPPEVADDE
jgi:hypothetical protein